MSVVLSDKNYRYEYYLDNKKEETDIVNSHDNIDILFNEINHCKTVFGELSLNKMLRTFIYDYNTLINRQEIIKKVCIEPYKVSKIRKILDKINKYQNLVDEWLEYGLDYSLFSSYPSLNVNYYLDAINKAKYSSIIITIIIYIVVYVYAIYTGRTISFYDYLCGIYKSYVDSCSWLLSFVLSSENILFYLSHMISVMYIVYSMINFYRLTIDCKSHYDKCEGFVDKFGLIKTIIDKCEQIASINIIDSTDIINQIEKLKMIFKPQFLLGDYLMIQYNRDQYKNILSDVVGYVGSVDAYISISHLLTKHYCLPFFIKSELPTLHVSQMWNPLMSYEVNVKNDFSPINKALTLITGPNKAGKSTYMRTIHTNIYLAQTIGVASCDEIIVSPYRYLFTYLNVPDLIGRESLFEAELNRIYDYYTFVKSLKENEFSLAIIDELFTGTNPKEGAATSASFCKFLSQNNNSTNIVSTHFNHNNISNDNINYCKFSAQYDNSDNKYKFNYLVTNGVSDQHIAIELLKEKGYDQNIVDNALLFLNNP